MLDGIEALIALERCGTVSEAALSLRLTQSAVSKRIQALQNELGFRLTVPAGRRIQLTTEAKIYMERARPLLVELQNISLKKNELHSGNYSLGMADSIASSWGPGLLKKTLKRTAKLNLQIHAHRSALILESVRLGRYHMGLCALSAKGSDLISFPIVQEPMMIVHSQFERKIQSELPIITIETGSATWPGIAEKVQARFRHAKFIRVESFAAAYQMAVAGFGNALVPRGLLKCTEGCQELVGIHREISLVTRKAISQQAEILHFIEMLKIQCENLFG